MADRYISRPLYLERLIQLKDKDLIKVVTGIRRCGKSVLLMELYRDWLLAQGIKPSHIIQVDLEDKENAHLRDADELYQYVLAQKSSQGTTYVMIDEIQYVDGFVDVLNSLKKRGCDVYVTGSNSKLLSTDIETELRGRSIEIRVWPLSFAEFHAFRQGDPRENMLLYIQYGGMPYAVGIEDFAEKNNYLKMLEDTVATKDIIDRYKIRNRSAFQAVYDFLCSNIASLVSTHKITNTLVSNGHKSITAVTVGNYLSYLCESFLFEKAVRFDVKGKAYLKTLNKYYIADLGMRNAHLNYRQVEPTHALENLVYYELRRRGLTVDIGKNREKEIDFVAVGPKDTYYIQVAYSMSDESKKETELESFKGIDDGYKKIVITMDDDPFTLLEHGYRKLYAIDFFLNPRSLEEV